MAELVYPPKFLDSIIAPVAELAYAQRLERCLARVRGSNPLGSTKIWAGKRASLRSWWGSPAFTAGIAICIFASLQTNREPMGVQPPPRALMLPTIKAMIYFTAYANKKFLVLARHSVVFSREEVTFAAGSPDAVDDTKKPLIFARKKLHDNRTVCVVYKNEGGLQKIITFYPF